MKKAQDMKINRFQICLFHIIDHGRADNFEENEDSLKRPLENIRKSVDSSKEADRGRSRKSRDN